VQDQSQPNAKTDPSHSSDDPAEGRSDVPEDAQREKRSADDLDAPGSFAGTAGTGGENRVQDR